MKYSLLIFSIFCTTLSYGQDDQMGSGSSSSQALDIFIDCNFCDISFMKQNLKNVNFVRDRKVADVHLLFTRQRNGAGGWEERIQFIGMKEYAKFTDTLDYAIDVNMTSDDKRRTQLKYIEFGLLRFWLEKGLVDQLSLKTEMVDTTSDGTVDEDPWNNWVFGLDVGGSFSGQETSSRLNVRAEVNARRITDKNKFLFEVGMNQRINTFDYDTIKTIAKQQRSWIEIEDIISINDHWSTGVIIEGGNNIFSNLEAYGDVGVGIEYDFFKYEHSYEKQIIMAYHIGALYNNYYDTTIFGKAEEFVGWHKFILGASTNKEWGRFSSTVTYRNYLHDFALNSLSIWMNWNIRLFKGFTWRISGGFSINRNQINISGEGATAEEVLLQQQQLASGFNYWGNTGIRYNFGSIYNTVVNPRFDF